MVAFCRAAHIIKELKRKNKPLIIISILNFHADLVCERNVGCRLEQNYLGGEKVVFRTTPCRPLHCQVGNIFMYELHSEHRDNSADGEMTLAVQPRGPTCFNSMIKVIREGRRSLNAKEERKAKSRRNSNAVRSDRWETPHSTNTDYFICTEEHLSITFGIHWELL